MSRLLTIQFQQVKRIYFSFKELNIPSFNHFQQHKETYSPKHGLFAFLNKSLPVGSGTRAKSWSRNCPHCMSRRVKGRLGRGGNAGLPWMVRLMSRALLNGRPLTPRVRGEFTPVWTSKQKVNTFSHVRVVCIAFGDICSYTASILRVFIKFL